MRDRDVRNAIRDALMATNAFDSVSVAGIPEDYGSGSSGTSIAVIEPDSSQQEPRWDSVPEGGMVVTSRVRLTLIVRLEDPQLRDEAAERLVAASADAVNGSKLGDIVLPQKSLLSSWRWRPPTSVERRIEAVVVYQYLSAGANTLDESA